MPGGQYPPGIDELRALGCDGHRYAAGSVLWRIHYTASAHPVSWNRVRTWGPVESSRWDPHPESAADYSPLGAAYLGESVDTCLAEVFQTTRFVDVDRDAPYVTALRTTAELALADLTGPWLTRAGASAQVAIQEMERTRAWARAIHAAWPDLDGVIAPSAMVGSRNVIALWDEKALPTNPGFSVPLNSPAIAADVAAAASLIGYRSNIVL